ncbi:sensor histidine kinase [Streptomyces sp. C10-9-1]|uniref:sensor histidine kinase n=1 Tax=Streptomyces sp. C10-9-1 TaxID=1859285 RepID=UPI003D73A4FC
MPTPRTSPGDESARPGPGPTARRRRAHAGPPAVEHTGHAASSTPPRPGAGSAAGSSGGRRLLPRARSVRARVVCLLMVPVVALLTLWGLATVTAAQDLARARLLQRLDTRVAHPAAAAVTALQAERHAALRQSASPSGDRAAALRTAASRTDAAVDRLAPHGGGAPDGLPREVGARLAAFVRAAGELPAVRRAAASGDADREAAYRTYTSAVESALAVGGTTASFRAGADASRARALAEVERSAEMLAREDALLSSARLTGELGAAHQRLFTGAAAARTALGEAASTGLDGPARREWSALAAHPAFRGLRTAEERVSAAAPGRRAAAAVSAGSWAQLRSEVGDRLRAVQDRAREGAAEREDPFTAALTGTSGAAVVLGLVAAGAALAVSVRIGRGLVLELALLRNGALEIARRRLPEAMRRLRAGDPVDLPDEAPAGPPAPDEIAEVAQALTTVHRAALEAAAERAELAGGVSGVFVNLARRSQALVHRQLALLDGMERRAEDPGELEDLFRLDHLTTRMRRHAESLIILSGAAPGRAWSRPVSLTSVVRAAVAEIEDYARVEIRGLTEASLPGAAVADTTHLLAELVENATQFSPPHTRVRVSGEIVGNGYAVEVEDRGLGMGREALDEANRRLARPEGLDLLDSDRLGLFVVGRLAARHGVTVRLGTSPYGGTTAVVLLPHALLQDPAPRPSGRPAEPRTGAPRAQRPPAAPDPEAAGAPRTGAPRTGPADRPGAPRGASASGGAPERAAEGPADPAHARATEPRAPGVRPAPTAVPRPPSAARGAGHPAGAGEPAPPGVHALRPRPAPPGAAAPPRPAPASAAPHRPAPPRPAPEADGGLPRRIRQAHLAPQLRTAPAAPGAPSATALRTPEAAREQMAAYREGWARGGGAAPGPVAPAAPARSALPADPPRPRPPATALPHRRQHPQGAGDATPRPRDPGGEAAPGSEGDRS